MHTQKLATFDIYKAKTDVYLCVCVCVCVCAHANCSLRYNGYLQVIYITEYYIMIPRMYRYIFIDIVTLNKSNQVHNV